MRVADVAVENLAQGGASHKARVASVEQAGAGDQWGGRLDPGVCCVGRAGGRPHRRGISCLRRSPPGSSRPAAEPASHPIIRRGQVKGTAKIAPSQRQGLRGERSQGMGDGARGADPVTVFEKGGADRAPDSVLHLDDVLVDVVHVYNLGGGRGGQHGAVRRRSERSCALASHGRCGTEHLHAAGLVVTTRTWSDAGSSC